MNQELFIEEKDQKSSRVDISCPICQKKRDINVPKNFLKNHGLISISIPSKSLCEHNFQVLLDSNFSVQRYQKEDFEIGSNTSDPTEFNCLLCGAKIIFNINNEDSYIKKNPNEKLLGKELCSYEVVHLSKDEFHINNVIVENNGQFRDYLNTNIIPLEKYKISEDKNKKFYKISNENQKPLEIHPIFNIFLIFNTNNNWIFELVAPSLIDIMELTTLLNNKVQETLKEYSTKPEYFKISVLEEIYHIWNSGNNFICINLNDSFKIPLIKSIVTNLIDRTKSDLNLIAKSPRILLMPEFFNHSNIYKNQEYIIDRLIFDDLLYSKIEIKFKKLVPQIIDRLSSMLSIDQDYLTSYFNTNLNTVEFLKATKNTNSLEKFLNVIDFVNRRKLLM